MKFRFAVLAALWLFGFTAAQAQQIMELTPNTGVGSLSATSPIVITGSVISCPTCGTSAANVQSVGVANANGTSGTVANPTTTPVITLFPTYSGIAKATSGTGYAAAVAGTDYVAPGGSGASLTGITFSQLGGVLLSNQMVALTGDVTNNSGSAATTLAIVNANVGNFTNANITVDAKGRITAASNGTGGGGGGISGPGTTVIGYAPLWGNTTGTSLAAGLPVGLTGNSTIVETNSSGTIAPALMPIATNGALGAVRPDGTTITINGSGVISVVGSCAATSVVVGTTTVGGGTSGYILYNNAGVVGNMATTGSGNVVLATAPTLTLANATGLPLATGVTGTLQAAQEPAYTGDTTKPAASLVTTTVAVHGVSYPATPGANTVPVVTGSNTVAYEAVPNAALANASTTVNGVSCTLGSTCSPPGTPYVPATYTSSGAIAITDSVSVINSSSNLAMTLANSSSDGFTHVIKRWGSGAVTLTAEIDGVSQTITMNTGATLKESVTLQWIASLSSYALE